MSRIADEQNAQKRKAGSGRGAAKNIDRLAEFGAEGSYGSADWGSCPGELIAAVVVKITALGGAVTFGLSRDQGAHNLTLMLSGNRKTLWFNGDADLESELRTVVAKLDSMD